MVVGTPHHSTDYSYTMVEEGEEVMEEGEEVEGEEVVEGEE